MRTRYLSSVTSLAVLLAAGSPAALGQIEVGPVVDPATGNRYARLAATTWLNARGFAQALGGQLVTINSAAENAFVQSIAAADSNSVGCYIGLNDSAVEGTFTWSSGQFSPYSNWAPGEPNNFGGGEDHAVIMPATGIWNDAPGVLILPAIVEFTGPIRVPQEFPTIAAAIAAAIDGQTILVDPGTYVGTIDFGYKKLVVRSTQGPAVTRIVGDSPTAAALMVGGQGAETQLEGFRISTSVSTSSLVLIFESQVIRNCVMAYEDARFGITMAGSGTADSCVVTNMYKESPANAGIEIFPLYRNITPTVQNCTVLANQFGVFLNGALYPESRVRVVNSIVRNNGQADLYQNPGTGQIIASYCNLSMFSPEPTNINADPRFAAVPGPDGVWGSNDDDFRLLPGSPCIDRGSNSARAFVNHAGIPLDPFGAARFADDAGTVDLGVGPGLLIDMGAAEFRGRTVGCIADFNNDGNLDPDDLGDFINVYFQGCP